MSKDPPYVVEGVFFTKRDGPIKGKATVLGDRWHVVSDNGQDFMRSDIFLDTSKKVLAPKNDMERENGQNYVKGIVDKYQGEVDSYLENESYKDISGSYDMGFKMAQSLLQEYKRVYINYFKSNSLKCIFGD